MTKEQMKPRNREPDFTNSVGTKFWIMDWYKEKIEQLGLEVTVYFTEYIDADNEVFSGYVMTNGTEIILETVDLKEVDDILLGIEEQLKCDK